jgi:hypothetical protein
MVTMEPVVIYVKYRGRDLRFEVEPTSGPTAERVSGKVLSVQDITTAIEEFEDR